MEEIEVPATQGLRAETLREALQNQRAAQLNICTEIRVESIERLKANKKYSGILEIEESKTFPVAGIKITESPIVPKGFIFFVFPDRVEALNMETGKASVFKYPKFDPFADIKSNRSLFEMKNEDWLDKEEGTSADQREATTKP